MAKPGPKPGSALTLKAHNTITEGDTIGVLLSNRPDRVWLDRADYERIVAAHGHRAWTWVKDARYVRVRPAPTENVPVARLVLESDGSGFVHFTDGDRLNLRRKNLSVQPHREQYRVLKLRPPGGWGRRIKEAVKEPGRGLANQSRPPLEAAPQQAPAPAFKLPDRLPIPVVLTVKRTRPVHR